MKISRSIFATAIAITFLMASCRETPSKKQESTKEHGHEHDADGSHMQDETVEQEEFQVGKDSMETKPEEHGHENDLDGNHSNDDDSETHKHDDGKEHHDH